MSCREHFVTNVLTMWELDNTSWATRCEYLAGPFAKSSISASVQSKGQNLYTIRSFFPLNLLDSTAEEELHFHTLDCWSRHRLIQCQTTQCHMEENATEQQNKSFRTALCIMSSASMDTMKKHKDKTNKCDVYRPVRGRQHNSLGSNPSVLHMLLGAIRVPQRSRLQGTNTSDDTVLRWGFENKNTQKDAEGPLGRNLHHTNV